MSLKQFNVATSFLIRIKELMDDISKSTMDDSYNVTNYQTLFNLVSVLANMPINDVTSCMSVLRSFSQSALEFFQNVNRIGVLNDDAFFDNDGSVADLNFIDKYISRISVKDNQKIIDFFNVSLSSWSDPSVLNLRNVASSSLRNNTLYGRIPGAIKMPFTSLTMLRYASPALIMAGTAANDVLVASDGIYVRIAQNERFNPFAAVLQNYGIMNASINRVNVINGVYVATSLMNDESVVTFSIMVTSNYNVNEGYEIHITNLNEFSITVNGLAANTYITLKISGKLYCNSHVLSRKYNMPDYHELGIKWNGSMSNILASLCSVYKTQDPLMTDFQTAFHNFFNLCKIRFNSGEVDNNFVSPYFTEHSLLVELVRRTACINAVEKSSFLKRLDIFLYIMLITTYFRTCIP